MYPELLVRHTITARSRGVLRLTALCLAWLGLGLTSAAAAALPAHGDFDHDGVPDTAIVRPTGTGSQIVVRLSGSAVPLYLSPAAPVRALRSADVTGDGVADLIADSPAGLHVWVSTGRTLVPAAHAAAISAVRTRALHAPTTATPADDDPCWDPRPAAIASEIPATVSHPVTRPAHPAHAAAPRRAPGTRTAPRGPPLA
jgi:hypothetical protein